MSGLIVSKPTTDDYRKNWMKVFGKKATKKGKK